MRLIYQVWKEMDHGSRIHFFAFRGLLALSNVWSISKKLLFLLMFEVSANAWSMSKKLLFTRCSQNFNLSINAATLSTNWIRILYTIPKNAIPNGHHPKWTQSRMQTIPNGHHPEWTQSQIDTFRNGHDPEVALTIIRLLWCIIAIAWWDLFYEDEDLNKN